MQSPRLASPPELVGVVGVAKFTTALIAHGAHTVLAVDFVL